MRKCTFMLACLVFLLAAATAHRTLTEMQRAAELGGIEDPVRGCVARCAVESRP